jgi:hypothetical protein
VAKIAHRKQISAACTITVPLIGVKKKKAREGLPVLEGQEQFVPVIGRDELRDGMEINILFDGGHFFLGLKGV